LIPHTARALPRCSLGFLWRWICRLNPPRNISGRHSTFFGSGPRRFSDELIDKPDRYLTPFKFFVGSLTIFGAVILVGVETLKEAEVTALAPYKSSIGTSPNAFIARHLLYVVVFMLYGTFGNRFMLWWPLKSPANTSNVLTAKFYASAALVPFAVFDALAVCMIVFVSPYVAISHIPWLFVVSWLCEVLMLGAIMCVYDLRCVGAFCQLRVRRLLEAQIILCVSGAVLGGAIGFAIGGTIGAFWELGKPPPFIRGRT
jgi:hypothetical protein